MFEPKKLNVDVNKGQLKTILPKDWLLFVAAVVEVVNPVIVNVEVVSQVANGTAGAPVVAAVELQLDPAKKLSVAAEPTNVLVPPPVAVDVPKFTTPVAGTVTNVRVPPVVVKTFPTKPVPEPAKLRVPAIKPVLSEPEKAKPAGVAVVKLRVQPVSITKSSPGAPVTVMILAAVPEAACTVSAVLLITLNCPTVVFAAKLIKTLPPVVVEPSPSTIKISVDVAVMAAGAVPEPSAAVFQLVNVVKAPGVPDEEVPTQ